MFSRVGTAGRWSITATGTTPIHVFLLNFPFRRPAGSISSTAITFTFHISIEDPLLCGKSVSGGLWWISMQRASRFFPADFVYYTRYPVTREGGIVPATRSVGWLLLVGTTAGNARSRIGR